MSSPPYSFTFAQYVEQVNSPRTFFTVHGDLTPESLFMAYLNYAWLYHPESGPTLFRDLLVQCLVVQSYYLEHAARFYKQQREGWQSIYVPSVRGAPIDIGVDLKLKENIDALVKEWLMLCDQALYQQLYTARNGQPSSPKQVFRALSLLFALTVAVLTIFAVTAIHTSLAPAYLTPASFTALLFCYALSQAIKPSPKLADLNPKQGVQAKTIDEIYDHSEKIFDLKRSVVEAFSQGQTSYHLNEPFIEKVLSLSCPQTVPSKLERDSTKRTILFLAEEMLKQRYEKKYTFHYGYYYGSRQKDKDQCVSPMGEGPPQFDLMDYKPR